MERTFTEQEIKQIYEAEKVLRTRGLVVDSQDGAELAAHNAEQIQKYFDLNPVPVTVDSVLHACDAMRDQLCWLTPVQQEYRKLAGENPSAAEGVSAWLLSQKQLTKDGDAGLQNQITLLIELRGRDVTPFSIQQAIGRASFNGRALHFVPTPRRVDPRQHQDDGSGFLRDEQNPRYRNGRINHAYVEPGSKKETTDLDPSEARWRAMAEALRGNSHSKNAELERIHGRTWRETYELRKKALNQNPVTVGRFGVS